MFLLAVGIAGWDRGAEPARAGDPLESSWREAKNCGPNAVYLLLRAQGWRGKLADVRARIAVGDRGASLLDLWRAVEAEGVPAEVIKTDLEGLKGLPLPAIVHLENAGLDYGHFELLLGIGSRRTSADKVVKLIDPITATRHEVPLGEFQRYWTAYVLIRKPPADRLGWAARVALYGGAAGLLAFCVSGWLGARGRPDADGVVPSGRGGRWTRARRPAVVAAVAVAVAGLLAIRAGAVPGRPAGPAPPPNEPAALTAYPIETSRVIEASTERALMAECLPDSRIGQASAILHFLRLWGPSASFDSPDVPTGRMLLDRILDNGRYEEAYRSKNPILVRTGHGARFSESLAEMDRDDVMNRESHVGQALSVLGELGIPLDRAIGTATGPATLRDVLSDLVANFNPEIELDWAVQALAFYLSPRREWTNKYGRRFTFDEMAASLLGRRLGGDSPCAGTHTLYTMTVLLQVDRDRPILTPSVRERVEAYLAGAVAPLGRTQRADGSWDQNWAVPEPATAGPSEPPGSETLTTRSDAVLATGHLIEWMAMRPPGLRLPDDRLVRAARFIAVETGRVGRKEVLKAICPFTHGPRGILLLGGGGTLRGRDVELSSR